MTKQEITSRVAVGAVVEEMPPLVDCTDAMHSLGDTNKKLKAMVEAAKRGSPRHFIICNTKNTSKLEEFKNNTKHMV